MIKILVVSSCSKSKKFSEPKQPIQTNIKSKENRNKLLKKYQNITCSSIEMYNGMQHRNIVEGVNKLQKIAKVDLYIISAGFGLIHSNDQIPAYECSFSLMSKQEIIERSEQLEIGDDFSKLFYKKYDLVYLALGKKYLESINDWENIVNTLTIAFKKSKNENVVYLKANTCIVSKLSKNGYKIHGTVGFKGNLLKIFAEEIYKYNNPKEKLKDILSSKESLEGFFRENILQ